MGAISTRMKDIGNWTSMEVKGKGKMEDQGTLAFKGYVK